MGVRSGLPKHEGLVTPRPFEAGRGRISPCLGRKIQVYSSPLKSIGATRAHQRVVPAQSIEGWP